MYSLNVPVPVTISRLARGVASECITATPRDRHTFVIKRLGADRPSHLSDRLRRILSGQAPFSASVTGIDVFDTPTAGTGPVAYLAIESPDVIQMHNELSEHFEPIEGIEGEDYVPHITIARGGDADKLRNRHLSDVFTVESLQIWAAKYEEPVERLALPL